MKRRFTRAVMLLLVTTFLPVLVLFSFPAGSGHASALRPKPTPTPSPTATPNPTAAPSPTPPSTGTWTLTGGLLVARYGIFTATGLPNGQVLVAGGNDGKGPGGYTASAELYTPSTGTWTSTGSMSFTRDLATATLLQSGKVLVAGGENYTNGPLAEAEVYDPASGTWTTTGSLNVTRVGATATLLQNGQVLVAGGNTGTVTSAELYTA